MTMGICDKVVIIGMGCTKFGERWSDNPESLISEAFSECIDDSAISREQIDAAWLGIAMDAFSFGPSGIPLSVALRLENIPVTRVENMCATGTEALRGAAYAVASGASSVALAVGVEKLKDTGYGGLPQRSRGVLNDMYWPNISAPGAFAQLAHAYTIHHRKEPNVVKRAMAHISAKSHENGSKNSRAHLRNRITIQQVLDAPLVADPIGLFDCCGVSDGAACAIVTTPMIASELGVKETVSIKAIQLAVSNGREATHQSWNGAYLPTTRIAAKRAYIEAEIDDPAKCIDLTEVHDCFSITELITMEDLGLVNEGASAEAVLDGKFDADGEIPCQLDGGLKCFGHPIGASGLRMMYECYTQLLGRAGNRQAGSPSVALTHNLGGQPHQNVCSVSILGLA